MKILLTVDKKVSRFEQDLEFFEKLKLMFPEIEFDVAENIEQEKRSISQKKDKKLFKKINC